MAVTNIFIARHGETNYNRQNRIQGRGIDAPLNEKGRLQARAVAQCLKSEGVKSVICSSLKRAKETAEIVAGTINVPVHSYPELDEMNFGDLEGRSIHEIGDELHQLHRNWKKGKVNFALNSGESPAAVLQRAHSRMEVLFKEHHGSDILFILHGRLIRILLSEWLGYGLSQMHRITHCNGALYHIRVQDGRYSSVYLNRTDHLEIMD